MKYLIFMSTLTLSFFPPAVDISIPLGNKNHTPFNMYAKEPPDYGLATDTRRI
ncbi:MAG TPA: hypothetical protein VK541_22030 [Pedobacter sp.]|uniref:hypothetical protein n=1 Tax=Pedobacter sp. TaxID=1411316 RepID=UPI002BB3A247|nr:hypothetical protein [Pedobacter sp.]HMI05182.1 hypothetical protein [Pedobacter sp.]